MAENEVKVVDELNIHQLINFVLDVTTHLICKVFHGLLNFEKFSFEGGVNFLPCD